jgi:acetyl-CoA C-acetyltransferase
LWGALEHAEIDAKDVNFVTVGVFNNSIGMHGFEESLASLHIPALRFAPAVHVVNADATGSAALYAALDFVECGRGRIALVVGAERMTEASPQEVHGARGDSFYQRGERSASGLAELFAGITSAYFDSYGDRSKELAMIAAKNHANAVSNPLAHVRKDGRALSESSASARAMKRPLVAI